MKVYFILQKKRFIQAKKEKKKLDKFLEKKIWGAHIHRLKVIGQIIKEEFRARSYDASYNHLDILMLYIDINSVLCLLQNHVKQYQSIYHPIESLRYFP